MYYCSVNLISITIDKDKITYPHGTYITQIKFIRNGKSDLTSIIKKGTHKSRKITHAKALLLYDSGKSRLEIQFELGIDINRYYRIKQRYFAGGLSNALEELPRSGQPPKITEQLEAQITSIACSDSPDGTSR